MSITSYEIFKDSFLCSDKNIYNSLSATFRYESINTPRRQQVSPPLSWVRKVGVFALWNLLCWSQNVHVMYKMCVISQNSRRKESAGGESSKTPWDRRPGHQKMYFLLAYVSTLEFAATIQDGALKIHPQLLFFAAKVQISTSESGPK